MVEGTRPVEDEKAEEEESKQHIQLGVSMAKHVLLQVVHPIKTSLTNITIDHTQSLALPPMPRQDMRQRVRLATVITLVTSSSLRLSKIGSPLGCTLQHQEPYCCNRSREIELNIFQC